MPGFMMRRWDLIFPRWRWLYKSSLGFLHRAGRYRPGGKPFLSCCDFHYACGWPGHSYVCACRARARTIPRPVSFFSRFAPERTARANDDVCAVWSTPLESPVKATLPRRFRFARDCRHGLVISFQSDTRKKKVNVAGRQEQQQQTTMRVITLFVDLCSCSRREQNPGRCTVLTGCGTSKRRRVRRWSIQLESPDKAKLPRRFLFAQVVGTVS